MLEPSEQTVLQRNLSRFLVGDVFNTITEDDILKIKGKDWFLDGRKLSTSEVLTIQNEARVLKQMQLWKLLNNRKKKLAQDRLVLESKTEGDLIAGKMMMYLIDVDESLLKSMSGE